IIDRDTIERISTRNLKRIRYADKDPRVNEQIDEIEEMTSRQIDVLRKITNEKIAEVVERNRDANEVRALVTERFANTATLRQLLELDDEMLLRVAHGMKRGIWFGTAVFDGAKEAELKALLAAAELPSSGKTPLYDG